MKLPKIIFAGALLTIVVAALLAQEDSAFDAGTFSPPTGEENREDVSSDGIGTGTSVGTSGASGSPDAAPSAASGAVTSIAVSEGAFDDGRGRLPPGSAAEGASPAGVNSRPQNPANRGNAMEDAMMQMMRQRGQAPDLAHQFREANEESVQIARRYRDLAEREPSSPQLESERQSLVNAVAAAFDVRQRWQQDEVARLQERLKRLESTIASRNRGRNQIIERRVAELINPEQVWGEESADSNHSDAAPRQSRPMLPPPSGNRGEDELGDSQRRQYLLETRGQPPRGRSKSDATAVPSSAARIQERTATSGDGTGAGRGESLSFSGAGQDFQFLIESVATLDRARAALSEIESSVATEQSNVENWQKSARSNADSVDAGQLRSAENSLHRAQSQMRRAEDDLKSATRQERQARLALETRIKLLQIDLMSAKVNLDQAKIVEARTNSLKERNVISQSEFDLAHGTARQAELAVQKAETLLHAAQQALKEAGENAQPRSESRTRLDPAPGSTRLDPASVSSQQERKPPTPDSAPTSEDSLDRPVPRRE